ncbi:MAG: hypothetical protein QOH68_4026, partial [Nocardioidaceae bacterium]|nr:hypothetical protein [Nocardioidaceae bacterium]
IKDLASNLRNMSPSHVQMIRVPLEPGSFNMGAVGNVVKWDPAASKRLFHALTEDLPIGAAETGGAVKVPIAPSNISVEVLNSTGQDGFAAKVAADLAKLGFRVSRTGNSPDGSDASSTVIRYGPSRADSAKTLHAAIPGSELKLDSGFGSGLQVLMGTDYQGTQKVKVVQTGESGTISDPRTADEDICS